MPEINNNEERYKTLIKEAGVAIYLLDLTTGKFLSVNDAVCKITGYAREELLSMKAMDIVDDEGKKKFQEVLKEIFAKGSLTPPTAEYRVIRKDGKSRYVIVNGSFVYDEAGMPKEAFVIAFDITDRKVAEEMKNNFINSVTHELRTPLSNIGQGVSLILEGITGSINEEQRKMLTIVNNNTDRLKQLITQVLDIQHLESSSIGFEFEEANINDLIKDIYTTKLSLAGSKKLDLALNLDNSLPSIKCNKNKISEVLENLLNNAIKFTEKGTITITTARKGDFIQVCVKDTGPGIKMDDIPKLFKKFSQIIHISGGSGLGLAISKDIIDAHKGKIWVESVFGKGSEFYFSLPINMEASTNLAGR